MADTGRHGVWCRDLYVRMWGVKTCVCMCVCVPHTVAGEKVHLGKPMDYPSFGWDNEYGSKVIQVQPFSASKFKVGVQTHT